MDAKTKAKYLKIEILELNKAIQDDKISYNDKLALIASTIGGAKALAELVLEEEAA